VKTTILNSADVRRLLTPEACIHAVEDAFRMLGLGQASPPEILGVHVKNGGFHIKAGVMKFGRNYFVAKTNANFPDNPALGLPTIQGVIVVNDADNGQVLALMDSIEITILRTGAATAIAAKYLSKSDSQVATIIGCGNQGSVSAHMLMKVRNLNSLRLFDRDHERAKMLAKELAGQLSCDVSAVRDFHGSLRDSDICVTCTPSKMPFLSLAHVGPGMFIAAVGSDNEEKNELDPALVAASKVVTDLTVQCAGIGELHHAISRQLMRSEDVYGELGEIIAGVKPCPVRHDKTIIFDSTGIGLQDVAAAVTVYENAIKYDAGIAFSLNG